MDLYHYQAVVDKIVDGDTIKVTIDLGFTVYWKSSCRLYGINTPELKSSDPLVRAKAIEAKQYLIDNLPIGTKILIHSRELDKYGRPLVEVYLNDRHINQDILSQGLAVKM